MRTLSGRLYVERNRLLAALPINEYVELRPHFEMVSLASGDVLYKPGRRITHVWFPQRAVASIITEMEDGLSVESASVGFEGMVGLPLFLGVETTRSKVMVQVADTATRISAEAFQAANRPTTKLAQLLQRFAQVQLETTAQTVACNRLHSLEERCARWLLTTHARVGRDTFHLTQAFLATMLGVHRPAVTIAASALQRAGAIRYHRGKLAVVDRERLLAESCECFTVTEAVYEALLGPFVGDPAEALAGDAG